MDQLYRFLEHLKPVTDLNEFELHARNAWPEGPFGDLFIALNSVISPGKIRHLATQESEAADRAFHYRRHTASGSVSPTIRAFPHPETTKMMTGPPGDGIVKLGGAAILRDLLHPDSI